MGESEPNICPGIHTTLIEPLKIILGFDDFDSLSRYTYLSLLGVKNVDLMCCCIYGPFTPFMGINTLSSGKISL